MTRTSLSTSPVTDGRSKRSQVKAWCAVLAVAVGIFSLVTTELLPVGLITPIGGSLGISDGTAGMAVSLPGVIAAVAAPVVAVAGGRLDRRWTLCALIGLMSAADLLAAAAPNFPVLLAARLLAGVSIGGFWVVAANSAVRLVPEESAGRATALVYGGVSVASVIGVPSLTYFGQLVSWRAAFIVVGGLGLLVLAALATVLPPLPADDGVSAGRLVRLLGNAGVRAGVLAALLLVTGHFAVFTFIGPVLGEVSRIGPHSTGTLLLAYGIAGVIGNFAAGAAASRNVLRVLCLITAALTAVLALLPVIGGTKAVAVGLLAVWGFAYGGVGVSLQMWVFKASSKSAEAVGAVFVMAFNLSISLGALIGGHVMDRFGAACTTWTGAVLMALTVVPLAMARRQLS
ncbi:MFS transporter [Kitasatospora sp. HPMI-4]|uniref:MFS transporter n=1 Tax=Kitasatospora sp. HPMI-4 TaxID=3448443 RepID=UPI003F1D38B5